MAFHCSKCQKDTNGFVLRPFSVDVPAKIATCKVCGSMLIPVEHCGCIIMNSGTDAEFTSRVCQIHEAYMMGVVDATSKGYVLTDTIIKEYQKTPIGRSYLKGVKAGNRFLIQAKIKP